MHKHEFRSVKALDSYFSQPALAGLTVLADYINEHPDYLDNVTIVRGLLEIYLEDDKRLKNLMLAAFLEGIPSALAEHSEIEDDELSDYAVILTSDYDFSPAGAASAVAGWACILGKYPQDKLSQFVRSTGYLEKKTASLPIVPKEKKPVSYTSAMEFADVISNPALAPDPSIGGKNSQIDIAPDTNKKEADDIIESKSVAPQLEIEKNITAKPKETADSALAINKKSLIDSGSVVPAAASDNNVPSLEVAPASEEESQADEHLVLENAAKEEKNLDVTVSAEEHSSTEPAQSSENVSSKAVEAPAKEEEAPERALEQSRERGKKTAANWLASAVQSLGDISNERLRSYPSAPIAESEKDEDVDELSEEELAAVEAGIKLAEEEEGIAEQSADIAEEDLADAIEDELDGEIVEEELDGADSEDDEIFDEDTDDSELDEEIDESELENDEAFDEDVEDSDIEEDIEEDIVAEEESESEEDDNDLEASESVAAKPEDIKGKAADADNKAEESQSIEPSAAFSAPVPRAAAMMPKTAQTSANNAHPGASVSSSASAPQIRPDAAKPAAAPQPAAPQSPVTARLSPAAAPQPAAPQSPVTSRLSPAAAPQSAAPQSPVTPRLSPAPVHQASAPAPRPQVPSAAAVPQPAVRPAMASPAPSSGSNRTDVRRPTLESVRREAALRRDASRKDAGAPALSEQLDRVPSGSAPGRERKDRGSFEKLLFSDSSANALPKEQVPSGNFTPASKKSRSDSQDESNERIAPSSLSAAIAAKTAKAGFAVRNIETTRSVAPAIDGPQLGAAEVSSLSEALAAKSAVDKRGFAKKFTPGQKVKDEDIPKLDAGGVRTLSEALAAKSVDKSRLGGASRSAFKPTESFKSSEENVPIIGTDGVRSLSEALAAKTKPKAVMSNAMRSSMIQAPSADNSLRKSALLTSSERITVKKTAPLPNVKTYLPDCEVGDTVLFGNYCQNGSALEPIEWYVLENADRELLLLSRFAIEAHSFNNTANGANWDECSLRFWLNGAFLKKAFSPEEQKRIVFSYNINAENKKYGTFGGENTDDKVFILSIDEAEKLLNETIRSARPTSFASEQGAVAEGELGFCKFWLRSPGKEAGFTAIISSNGNIAADGEASIIESTAVRPAIRVKI